MSSLGQRIKWARENLGMNQKVFAEVLGLKSATAISRYEKNQREPEATSIVKIAKLVSKTTDWLLTGEERGMPRPSEHQALIDKFVAVLERGDPEIKGYIRGEIEAEFRRLKGNGSDGIKKGA